MKSKKILALLVVATLALGGIAWAALSAGVLTSSPATQATNLAAGPQYAPGWDPANPDYPAVHQGVNVQNYDVTLEGNVVLPVLGAVLGTTVNDATLAPWVAALPPPAVAPDGYYSADPQIYTVFDKVPVTALQRDGAVRGSGQGMGVGGAIQVAADRVFTIKPGIDAGVFRNVGNPALVVDDFTDRGILRIYGGTTNVYAPNNNAPTVATEWNNYAGGTFIWNGRLNVKHSNALGYGHVTAMADTVLGFDYNDEISFGGIPFQGAPNLGGVDGGERQQLWVQRRNAAAGNNTDGTANVPWDRAGVRTARRAAPVEFNVTNVVEGHLTKFTAHTGLRENITEDVFAVRTTTNNTLEPNRTLAAINTAAGTSFFDQGLGVPTVLNSVQLLKTGEGTMSISNIGARHTGGTWVRGGTLELLNAGESGNRYVGELGYTWRRNAPVAAQLPVETNNPQLNFAAIDVPQRHLNNALRIDEGAKVHLNRDQFFGNFDGEGEFEVNRWGGVGSLRVPQITVLMDRLSTNADDAWQKDSTFSGLASGQFHLVLRGGPAKTENYLFNADNTKLTLTGADNDITEGDTTIADGTLSINSIGQIGPGDIRVGLAADDGTRGILRTDAVPTFHGHGNFTVPQLVTTAINTQAPLATVGGGTSRVSMIGMTDLRRVAAGDAVARHLRMRRVIPNLAADRGATVKFENVSLTRHTPDVLDNGVGYQVPIHFTVNNQFGSSVTPYAGLDDTVAAQRTYLDGVSLANPVQTERTWAGTVSFVDEYTFPDDATAAEPFNAAVMNGVWHLEKTPIAGYSRVYVSPGATLSFGSEARDFLGTATAGNTSRDPGMDIMVAANSRLRVKVNEEDFKSSKEQATVDTAILKAAYIDYSFANSTKSQIPGTKDVGFQMGEAYKNQELVIELDLSALGNRTIPAGTWINVVTSHETTAMQSLNYTLENGELLAKVKFASTGTQDYDFSKAEAYVDVDSHSIIFYAKDGVSPTDPTDPVDPTDPTTTQEKLDAMSDADKATFVEGANNINVSGSTATIQSTVPNTTGTSVSYPVVFLTAVAEEERGASFVVDSSLNGTEQNAYMYSGKDLTDEQLATAFGTKSYVADDTRTIEDGAATFIFNPAPDSGVFPNGDYTMAVQDADGNVMGMTQTATVNVTDPIDPVDGGGSSGCDAGFGAFALLAMGAAVVLRKKD